MTRISTSVEVGRLGLSVPVSPCAVAGAGCGEESLFGADGTTGGLPMVDEDCGGGGGGGGESCALLEVIGGSSRYFQRM